MLRRSPSNRAAANYTDGEESISDEELDQDVNNNGRLIITSTGVKRDTTERSPLIARNGHVPPHRPDWIHGESEQDIEGQIKRKGSWPKINEVKERGADLAKVVFNPKRWDKQAIMSGGVGLVQMLPAIILGLLLNVLDALSYGEFHPPHQVLSSMSEEI